MNITEPHEPSYNTYKAKGCRCDGCRAFNAERSRKWRNARQKKYQGSVDRVAPPTNATFHNGQIFTRIEGGAMTLAQYRAEVQAAP